VSVTITRRSRPEEPSVDDEVAPSMLRRSPRPIPRLCRRDPADTVRSLAALSPALSRGDCSRLARPPATQASAPFWEDYTYASRDPNGARRLLQHTTDTWAHPTDGLPSLAQGGCPKYALPFRELTQTTGSEPRVSLPGANPSSCFRSEDPRGPSHSSEGPARCGLPSSR